MGNEKYTPEELFEILGSEQFHKFCKYELVKSDEIGRLVLDFLRKKPRTAKKILREVMLR